ncbi:hypothetical protein [Taylorella asinigenitalis]|uniref:Uncharacterized protein n=1 Tax=Taylorella asinigenitalis (strain MCE3) TaxID=1008459 RepID=G4QBX9_TAYAM|nr:hypothetical protein [Taylorella asinigenitalis]AEP36795.1 hypothetical protein TASI_1036 [Taylorella asinigenitalis MCE3]
MQGMKKKIEKAVKLYKYNKSICTEDSDSFFIDEYNFFARDENLKNYSNVVWVTLSGLPDCTHAKAKNLLFQGNEDCWKFFERTAVFWAYGHSNDVWLDHLKGAFEYSLYVERKDLIYKLIDISLSYLTNESNLSNKEFKLQSVYPSTQLVHFLIEKWIGENPAKEFVLKYGSGYGIYQNIIDNWNDLSKLNNNYWNELCDYHLNGIGLQQSEKRGYEEFLDSGLVPMELINLIKVRKKLGLDVPVIENDLFSTNMAKEPVIPTGYNEQFDVKFKLIELTVKNKRRYTYNEVIDCIRKEYGCGVDIFW